MTEKRFFETAKTFKGEPVPFSPFPKASERSAYETLGKELKEKIIKIGETRLNFDFPVISATDFMRFKHDGDRAAFEAKYFEKRDALCDLIAAECVMHTGQFMNDIIDGIYSICEESAWQLPAHNSYLRSAPQFILPDVTRPVLDLFACETGALLAAAACLLENELNAVSPFIITCIEDNLMRRIIIPYLTYHFWWMGADDEPMCNWTVWCTQNVLITAFLTPWSEKAKNQLSETGRNLKIYPMFNAIILRASESIDYFLKDYGDDGCCNEGAEYYRHAGLCLYGAMNILNSVTDGLFTPFFSWDKIKNIASYILNVHVDDKYYFNFADCSPVAGRAGVREYLFGKATGNNSLSCFAAKDFRAGGGELFTDSVNAANLYYRMQTIFNYEELMNTDVPLSVSHKDIYYPSAGLFIVRSDNFTLAVKMGNNGDSHNHNDVGSITLYKDGRPVLVDIGVETYTEKTFSDKRYELHTMQSCYHNLPTLMGTDEHDGKQFGAKDVIADLNENTPFITAEIIGAYLLQDFPDGSYRRTVTLYKAENAVKLEDHTNISDVILNFITYEKPVMTEILTGNELNYTHDIPDKRNLISKNIPYKSECTLSFTLGNAGLFTTGVTLVGIDSFPVTDSRLKRAWDHDLYRIRLKMTHDAFTLTIK